MLACEVDGVPHIGGAGAAGDQGGFPVEDPVPDTPARIVVRATLKQQVAAQAGREGLDRGAWQRERAPSSDFAATSPTSLRIADQPLSGGGSESEAGADEFASLHDGYPPGRTVLPAGRHRTKARITKPMTSTMKTSRTASRETVASSATQATSASTEMTTPPANMDGRDAFTAAQHDERGGGRAVGEHAGDHEDREDVLERARDGEQPGERRIDGDGGVRRAPGRVHGGERPRQVAGLGQREDAAGRDQHLHGVAARRRDYRRNCHQRSTDRAEERRGDVGQGQLGRGGVRQYAEAGQHQQQVEQAGNREPAQDADGQVPAGIAHLAGHDGGDVEADAGEEGEQQGVHEAVRLARFGRRQTRSSRRTRARRGQSGRAAASSRW